MIDLGVLIRIAVSLSPVMLFLVVLIWLDSFKLVSLRQVVRTIVIGAIVAGVCYLVNSQIVALIEPSPEALFRYIAPLVEETSKALFIVFLIKSRRTGFMVDAAIYGFAVGAGFAVVENVYYLQALGSATIFTWIVRGFGTAIMHGGATAVFAIITKTMSERREESRVGFMLPGLIVAFAIHSAFNHLFLPPIVGTLILVLVFPIIISVVFQQSEKYTRDWLGVGFDSDQELLELIKTGNISDTRVGRYLQSLREHFSGEIIADMLCWLRIQVELSIKVKGVMLLREAGFKPAADAATRAKLEELSYLEESIGKTGLVAISPIVMANKRDIWQMQLLDGN
ncbi:MAG: PrsW family intramembrane metalloprotease [Rhodothermales bacterium]|nr:PrsW family intramembrane metalloprotease [Rhodothermales bacterium]